MHASTPHRLLTGLTLAAGLFLAGAPALAHEKEAHATGMSGRVPIPVLKIEKGEQCVEPTEEMRRNHMQKILHQRDKTVHQGLRTTQHSLKNCINCHADTKTGSVLGKEGFCESCHVYTSVKIDCFSCHTPLREPDATAAAAPPGSVRALQGGARAPARAHGISAGKEPKP